MEKNKYIKPEMNVIEIETQATLLDASANTYNVYDQTSDRDEF